MGPKKNNNRNKNKSTNNNNNVKPKESNTDDFVPTLTPELSSPPLSPSIPDESSKLNINNKDKESTTTTTVVEEIKEEQEVETCNNNTTTTTNNNVTLENKKENEIEQVVKELIKEQEKQQSEEDLNKDWKSLYFITSKQISLERIKTETLESLIIQKDKENQQLIEQVNRLETELLSERRRINKTVGTIRHGTRKLLSTVKFDHNIDIASIIDDLNNIDSSISASPSFAEDLNLTSASIANSTSNSFSDFSSDQLLNRLNSYHNSTSSLINSSNNDRLISTSNNSNSSNNNGTIRLSTSNSSVNSASSSIGNDQNNNNNNASSVNSFNTSNAPITSIASAFAVIPVQQTKQVDYIKCIVLVQSLARKWLARKRYKKLRTKRAIVEELFETESTYVNHLSNLLKIFVNPLKAKKGDSILPTDEFDGIFSSIHLIYKVNSYVLDQVDEIFKKFNKWSCFGEKLLKLVPLFNCYIDYIINFEFSQKNLKKALSSYSTFANFVKQGNTKKELDDLDLEDLLIMPVQRVPRYILIIKEIRKFTPLYHNDFPAIDKTLEAFKNFAESLNKKSGFRKQVLLLDDRILNYKDDITSNSRILVKEGPLKFKKSNEYAFLFNDMILICHPTHSKKVKKISLLSPNGAGSNSSSSSNNTSSSTTPINNNTPSTPSSPPTLRETASSTNILSDFSFTPSSSILNSSTNSNNSNSNSNNTSSSSLSTTTTVNEFHSSNHDINFKFLSKFMLDSKVKIIQDLTEPKFTVCVPDSYSIDFFAQTIEDRQSWITEINKLVSFYSNNLNQANLDIINSLQ